MRKDTRPRTFVVCTRAPSIPSLDGSQLQPDDHICSQLAIALQNGSTGIADVEAMGSQGGPALEEITPAYSSGGVAKPRSGGATGSEIVHVERNSGRGR